MFVESQCLPSPEGLRIQFQLSIKRVSTSGDRSREDQGVSHFDGWHLGTVGIT